MSFGKNRNLSNDLIYYYSSQPLPKNVLYKPRIFYSKVSSHSKITLNSFNWYNNKITNSMETSKIKTGSIITNYHNLKAEDPQESRRHH